MWNYYHRSSQSALRLPRVTSQLLWGMWPDKFMGKRGVEVQAHPFVLVCSPGQKTNTARHTSTLTHTETHCIPRVGPGAGWVEDGWWHHSPSRTGTMSKLRTHTDLYQTRTLLFFPTAKLPRHRGKHTQTQHCLTLALFRESGRMRSTLPSHCWCGPSLTLCRTAPGRPLCTRMCDVWVCMCVVCPE